MDKCQDEGRCAEDALGLRPIRLPRHRIIKIDKWHSYD